MIQIASKGIPNRKEVREIGYCGSAQYLLTGRNPGYGGADDLKIKVVFTSRSARDGCVCNDADCVT
jgi:hypothetical protein